MPLKIQRVPRGLNDLLNIFGGSTPIELEDRVRGGIDLMQLYGTTQLQSGTAVNVAAGEGAGASLFLSLDRWTVLFCCHATVIKTATMTALRADIQLQRNTINSTILHAEELGPFGATETGTVSFGPGLLPYPLLCPPRTLLVTVMNIIGTDATASCAIFAEFGTL